MTTPTIVPLSKVLRTLSVLIFALTTFALGLLVGANVTHKVASESYWIALGALLAAQVVGFVVNEIQHRRSMRDFDKLDRRLDAKLVAIERDMLGVKGMSLQ